MGDEKTIALSKKVTEQSVISQEHDWIGSLLLSYGLLKVVLERYDTLLLLISGWVITNNIRTSPDHTYMKAALLTDATEDTLFLYRRIKLLNSRQSYNRQRTNLSS